MTGQQLPPIPALDPVPKARAFYRVAGWRFIEKPYEWHGQVFLHTHMGCNIIDRWRRGGFRGRSRVTLECLDALPSSLRPAERPSPPQPPTVIVEHYEPCEVPRHMRCNYCWGPLIELPAQRFRVAVYSRDAVDRLYWHALREILWPDGASNERENAWNRRQWHLQDKRWNANAGGLYAREYYVFGAGYWRKSGTHEARPRSTPSGLVLA